MTLEDQRVVPLRPDVTVRSGLAAPQNQPLLLHLRPGVTVQPGPAAPQNQPAPPHRNQVTVRTAVEVRQEQRDAAQRTEVALRVALVTLIWLVSVSLLVGWGLTGPKQQGGTTSSALAAVLAVLLPFVAAVIATKNKQFIVGGVYVVLTLAMVLPAVGIAGAGG